MKPSLILAIVAWISVFVISWMLVFHNVPADSNTLIPYAVFFVVAVIASATASPRRGTEKEERKQ